MLQPNVLYAESILPIVRVNGNNIPIFIFLHSCELVFACVLEIRGDQEVSVYSRVSQCLKSADRVQWPVHTEPNCSSAHIW